MHMLHRVYSSLEEKCENSSGNELSGEGVTVSMFKSNPFFIFLSICCCHNFQRGTEGIIVSKTIFYSN